ncbi:MAG: hypothetical protein AAB932_03735 [Patescibacteria group bacterium]
MSTLELTIHMPTKQKRKARIEFDADQFERMAAAFGFISPEARASIERAERQYRAGKAKVLRSLKDLRKK